MAEAQDTEKVKIMVPIKTQFVRPSNLSHRNTRSRIGSGIGTGQGDLFGKTHGTGRTVGRGFSDGSGDTVNNHLLGIGANYHNWNDV